MWGVFRGKILRRWVSEKSLESSKDCRLSIKWKWNSFTYRNAEKLTCFFGIETYALFSRLFSDKWEENWVYSKHSGKEFGKFVRTAGKIFNDEEADKGKCLNPRPSINPAFFLVYVDFSCVSFSCKTSLRVSLSFKWFSYRKIDSSTPQIVQIISYVSILSRTFSSPIPRFLSFFCTNINVNSNSIIYKTFILPQYFFHFHLTFSNQWISPFIGLQTSQDARFYAVSTKFTPFSNKDKPLVVQFSVKHEQNIDCGGGYLKVFDCSLDQADMHGESPYLLMFGPDICGPGTKKVSKTLILSQSQWMTCIYGKF